MARVSLSKKQRFDVFHRDGFKCRYCGSGPASGCVLEVDHVIPVVAGGTNDTLNLVSACFDCNRGKATKTLSTPTEPIISAAMRRKLLKEQKEQLSAFLEFEKNRSETIKRNFDAIVAPISEVMPRFPRTAIRSVEYFLKHLPLEQIEYAMDLSADKFDDGLIDNPFLYFCAICHRHIKEKNGMSYYSESANE